MVKLELLPTGALLTVPTHGEGGSLGKGMLLGALGSYGPDAHNTGVGNLSLLQGQRESQKLLPMQVTGILL